MPRLDHRASAANALTAYEMQLLFAVLVEEINQLRRWVGQPELDEAAWRDRIRTYLQDHPHTAPPPGEEGR